MNNKTAFARSRRAGVVLCIPLIAGVLMFYAIPMAMLLWQSLRTPGGSFCGLQNYKELLCNPAFQLAAQNTAVLWAVSLPVDLVVGIGDGLVPGNAPLIPAARERCCVVIAHNCRKTTEK